MSLASQRSSNQQKQNFVFDVNLSGHFSFDLSDRGCHYQPTYSDTENDQSVRGKTYYHLQIKTTSVLTIWTYIITSIITTSVLMIQTYIITNIIACPIGLTVVQWSITTFKSVVILYILPLFLPILCLGHQATLIVQRY